MKIKIFYTVLLYFLCFPAFSRDDSFQNSEDTYSDQRKLMVQNCIARYGVKDQRILNAFLKVPRHKYVLPEYIADAYKDTNVPIIENQIMCRPYVAALMTQLLDLQGTERVLELGTGSGYHTSILSLLAKEVYTVDISKVMKETAEERLREMGYDNVYFYLGQGDLGWPEKAPFDVIIVGFAADSIIPELVKQLKDGGRLVIPVGEESQQLKLLVKENGQAKLMQTAFYTGVITKAQIKDESEIDTEEPDMNTSE